MLGPRFGNIPIQNADDRLDVEIEHDNRRIHGNEQPQFAVGNGGGRIEYDRGDGRDTSAALSRGNFNHSFEMKGGNAYVGGQSRETESKIAYVRDAGPTMPRDTRQEAATKENLVEASNTIKTLEAEGKIQRPKQPEQGNGQQQEQRPQSQQREQAQAQAQPQQQTAQEQEPEPGKRGVQLEQERQNALTSRLRGKLDALQGAGLQHFGERKPIESEKDYVQARSSYHEAKDRINKGEFAEMAERAAPASGNRQQGQSAEMSPTDGSFSSMADRAAEAAKPTPETGTGIKKDTGMEQG